MPTNPLSNDAPSKASCSRRSDTMAATAAARTPTGSSESRSVRQEKLTSSWGMNACCTYVITAALAARGRSLDRTKRSASIIFSGKGA